MNGQPCRLGRTAVRPTLWGLAMALGLAAAGVTEAETPPPPPAPAPLPSHAPAGAEVLIRACTRDGHSASFLVRPGVALDPSGRAAAFPPPVDAFMTGLSAVLQHELMAMPHAALLQRGTDEARRLSDTVQAWIESFNRQHGSRLAWALIKFGVSDRPQDDCPR